MTAFSGPYGNPYQLEALSRARVPTRSLESSGSHSAVRRARGLSRRSTGYEAKSLSTEEWLRCSKWAGFGVYHTARRLVKGREKLKSIFRAPKKRAGTGTS